MEDFDPIATLEGHFAGDLQPAEQSDLRAWLTADADRLAEVAAMGKMHALLTTSGIRYATENIMETVLAGEYGEVVAHKTSSGSRRSIAKLLAGLALSIGLLAAAAWWLSRPSDAALATVVATEDVVWKSAPLAPGDVIRQGELYIASGRLSANLTSQAELTIEGETQIDVIDAKAVELHRGQASFHCPPSAVGFVVTLPGGTEVIDLGTDFAIRIDDDGQSQVQVDKGEVEVRAPGEPPVKLVAGELVEVNRAGSERVGAVVAINRSERWHRQLESYAKAKNRNLVLPLNGNATPLVAQVQPKVTGELQPAIDRFGNVDGAVHFDGNSAVEYATTWPAKSFTISMWIKAADVKGLQYLIATESKGGKLGSRRLRLIRDMVKADAFVHGVHKVGANHLRAMGCAGKIASDRWTHLVVTYNVPKEGRVLLTVYVDGQLAAENRLDLDQRQFPLADKLTLASSPLAGDHGFRGTLDDLLLLDGRVLSSSKVRDLYQASRAD